MDKIDIDKYSRSWVTKYITEPDENGYIFKYFKNDGEHKPYPYEKQNYIIKMKKHYIWKYIPERGEFPSKSSGVIPTKIAELAFLP